MDVLSDAVTMMRAGRPHSRRTHFTAPWNTPFEPMDGAGFHVVLAGSCRLTQEGAAPLRLNAGDIVLLPREPGHALTDDPGSPTAELLCGAYVLDRSRTHPLLADLPDVIHLPAHVGRHPRLRTAIDLLGAELAEPLPGSTASVSALLDLLLLYMLRAWFAERSAEQSTGWPAALADPAVSAVLRAIHAEPAANWTVRSLGEQAGLSRTAFAERFTALVGRPPLAYLTWWRMTLAARFLKESDAPLATVAQRCGYSSEFAFAKTFKRELGVSPGVFRKPDVGAIPAATDAITAQATQG
jgi:AraC-like DNA-binding protein